MARDKMIVFRLNDAEVAKLDAIAAATGQNRSQALRLLLSAAAPIAAPAVELDQRALECKGGNALQRARRNRWLVAKASFSF